MLTFTDTTVDEKLSFSFSYRQELVTFDFKVTDPQAISIQSYENLANGILTTKNGKLKPSFFVFKDAGDGQFIKLSPTSQHNILKVEFVLYRNDHKVKIAVPFDSCQLAFYDALRWSARHL